MIQEISYAAVVTKFSNTAINRVSVVEARATILVTTFAMTAKSSKSAAPALTTLGLPSAAAVK